MEKGKKVIIATHGYLADGFVSALNIIVGDMKDLKAMCCYTSPDFNLDNQITQMMENHDFEKEDLVICTDILGGSVNNGFVKFLGTYPFHLITNINLAFFGGLQVEGAYPQVRRHRNSGLCGLFGSKVLGCG